MKKNLLIAVLMTIATTVLLGLIYPLVVTGLAQVIFPDKANGQLIQRNGQAVGSPDWTTVWRSRLLPLAAFSGGQRL